MKRGDTMVLYPVLIGEMAKREIRRGSMARCLGICDKALKNKLDGKTPFTWPEVKKIRREFFPDMTPDDLFRQADDLQ